MTLCFNAKIKERAFLALLFLGLFSCKKDSQNVGNEFVGTRNGFNIQFDTTLVLNAYSVQMDSVVTSKLTAYALGSIDDPFLGISKASLITQFGLPANSFTWGGASKLDSVVLQLRFRNALLLDGSHPLDYFGDKDAVHQLKVYLLKENLHIDSSYFSTRKYLADAIEMGSYTGKLNFTDSVKLKLGSENLVLPPHVRIQMNSNFNNLLFNAEQGGKFLSDAVFKESFKGLVIVDETPLSPGSGAIVYVKLNSNVTALTAYYKDSLAADFPIVAGIRGTEAAYNYYEHINRPASILQNIFSGQHRDTCYVQPLSGSKVRIELPNLYTALSNPKILLNSAEITFTPMAGTFNDPYSLPISMSLVGSDSLGRNIFLKDQLYETGTYYGGQMSYNKYTFRIVRHLQNLLDQNKKGYNYNYGMNLIIRADDPITAQRVILDTRKNSGNFKLKLTYTVIN